MPTPAYTTFLNSLKPNTEVLVYDTKTGMCLRGRTTTRYPQGRFFVIVPPARGIEFSGKGNGCDNARSFKVVPHAGEAEIEGAARIYSAGEIEMLA